MTRPADYAVLAGTLICSLLAYAIGQHSPQIACPDKLQGERLISTITTGNVTTCAYGVSYGRAITRRTKT